MGRELFGKEKRLITEKTLRTCIKTGFLSIKFTVIFMDLQRIHILMLKKFP